MVNQQVYSTELYTSKNRLYYMILNNKSVPFMVTALIVYYSRTWTDIHIRTGILIMCTLPFYFAIPESPRWLAQNGKEDMAMKVLIKMAKVNKRELSPSGIAKVSCNISMHVKFRAQSFTSLMADLRQDINRFSSFSRCHNRTFP